ncbi:MFS transporter [Paenibacillus sp. sgz302251]|uniref:MFS transporter n=1 Tax=Paenibacillus sp. sgz302251 TaxID=3414493 RepID=UPI003C7B1662
MRLLIAVAFGIMLNPLNSSMISVALTRLQGDFGLTFADSTWLISTYYLASAIGQPVMGKLTDIWGQKRMFLIGLGLVAAASMLAPLATSFGALIVFRMIQAVGSSTLYPAGMAAVRKHITEKQAQSLGVLNIFASSSAAFGPSIGGFLIFNWDWQAIFFINFPFIIASFILAIRAFPKDERPTNKPAAPDVGGIALFAVSIVCLLMFLLSLEQQANWWLLLVFAIAVVWFIRHETRRPAPFVNVSSLRKNVNVSLVYVQFILVNILFYSMFFGVPTYLQKVQGFEANVTGIVMLSIAGFSVVVSPLAGRWIDRTQSSKTVLLAGAIFAISGTLLLLTVGNHSSPLYLFAVLSLLGVSSGFNNLGLQTALFAFADPKETGIASGLFMTSRYLGTILSSSLLGMAFGQQVTTAQFHVVAIVGAAIGVLILLLSARMPSKAPLRQDGT